MPRLQSFELTIKTGENAPDFEPAYVINGFQLPFDVTEGSAKPGEVLQATGRPDSFPHSLHLTGPDEGKWDLAAVSITYYPYGEEPYTLEFEPLTLEAGSDLNIWQQRPEPVFDV
jgi:hypothetical protein